MKQVTVTITGAEASGKTRLRCMFESAIKHPFVLDSTNQPAGSSDGVESFSVILTDLPVDPRSATERVHAAQLEYNRALKNALGAGLDCEIKVIDN